MIALQIDRASLAYDDRGSGEPLVLIHGSASDGRTWGAQRDEFAHRYRVITYSRRFHWPNEPIRDGMDYSMAEQLDDLEAVLRRLGASPAHLVGHSYGGFLALLLAMRAPALVRSLVLAEPPVLSLFVSNRPAPSELVRLMMTRPRTAAAIAIFGATGMAPATNAAKRGDAKEAMRRFGRAVLGAATFHRLSTARLAQVDENAILAEFLGSGFLPLEAERIRQLQAPTLLVGGQRSPALFHRLTDALAELLPHAQRVTIDLASHIMHEDNAPAYNRAVMSFLARQHSH